MITAITAQRAASADPKMSAALAAGCASTVIPDMFTQLSGFKLICSACFNLSVGGGSYYFITPGRKIRPAFKDILLILLGIVLLTDISHKVPAGIGAAGMRSIVAVVAGITGIAIGSSCGIISVESCIAAGAFRLRIVGT